MFKDRKEGGEKLALVLQKYRKQHVLVLGIPRGGVETAYYVARELDADLAVVVTRKLGYPFNPEAAFGAIAEDGSLYIFDNVKTTLPPEIIQSVVNRERKEITRRINKLRKGKPLPSIKGRTVLIVDDGIATGATLLATIELCKKQGAGKIVVAAPVGGEQMLKVLRKKVDEVVILNIPHNYYAVSQGYYSFGNVDDATVVHLLEKWEAEHNQPVLN